MAYISALSAGRLLGRSGWSMTRSDRLADADRASLDAILAASAELAAVAAIMNERRGRKLLEPWTTALATGEPALRSFVTGLRADQDAVTTGSHGHKGAAAAWFGGLPVIGVRKHPKRAHLAQSSA